jgi:hypothetical protein
MNKIKRIIVVLFVICGLSLATYGIVWAAEGANWDVVDIYNENELPDLTIFGYVSMALRSDNYVGMAWMSDHGDKLLFRDCTSGDCATDAGGGEANWNDYENPEGYLILDDDAGYGRFNSIDYNSDDYPAVIYTGIDTSTKIRIAQYVASGGSGCATGVTDWSCFNIDNNDGNIQAHTDLSIDGNDRYHAIWKVSSNTLRYGYCDDYSTSGCDTAGDYSDHDIYTGTNQNSRIDSSSTGLIYASWDDGSNIYTESCDVTSTSCDAAGDWSATTTVASGLVYNGDIYVKDSNTIGMIFDYSGELMFAEYVGSGGNCDDSYSGSDAWDCHLFTGTSPYEGTDKWVGASVAYDASEYPHVVYQDTSLDDAVYYSCSSTNCAGSGASTWTADTIYEGSVGNDFGMMPTLELTSTGDPTTGFSSLSSGSYINVFYGELEQEDDDPAVPEFSSYKSVIFVALAAFGMFVVVMLVYRRKKK